MSTNNKSILYCKRHRKQDIIKAEIIFIITVIQKPGLVVCVMISHDARELHVLHFHCAARWLLNNGCWALSYDFYKCRMKILICILFLSPLLHSYIQPLTTVRIILVYRLLIEGRAGEHKGMNAGWNHVLYEKCI